MRRSGEARAALAILLRDAKLFGKLREESDWVRAEPPALMAAAPDEPSSEALNKLVQFLSDAERRFPRLPAREERDGLLLAEAVALVNRLAGDYHLLGADAAYYRALTGLERSDGAGSASGDAGRAASAIRLRYKLRDFDGARAAVAASGAELTRLRPDERAAHLVLMQDLARLEHDPARVLALDTEIRALRPAAEEPVRPGARFPSFMAGKPADLAETLQALLAMLARHRLAPREASLTAYLAALGAVEIGEFALAAEILRARPLAPDDESWLAASMAARLGLARSELGDYESSLHALEQAATLAGKLPGTELFRARLALNAARSYLGVGRLAEARGEALRALASPGLPADLRVRARILLGDVLYERARVDARALGDARQAFEAAGRELEAARRETPVLEDACFLDAVIAIDLANVLRQEALAIETHLEGAPEGEKVEAARELRRKAMELQDRALRSADAAKLHRVASAAAANLGELYLEQGDLGAAKSFADWAIRWARDLRLFETEWRCHWYRGRIADAEKNEDTADAEYKRAVEIVESYRLRVLNLESRSGLLNDKMSLYQDLARRELARGSPAGALSAAERAKARTLVESLGWRYLAFADRRQTRTYKEFIDLLAQSETSRERPAAPIFGARVKPLDPDALRARLDALKGEILKKEKSSRSAIAALIDGSPAGADAILRNMPVETTLIEYFSLGDRFVAFLVQDGAVEAVPLSFAPAELNAAVGRFLRAGAGDATLSRRLHGWLVEPVAGRVRHDRVIVVPYGILHQLPFETLRDARGGENGGFLLSRWEISYLPGASALRFFKGRSRVSAETARLLAVVDPDTDYDRDGKPDFPPLAFARKEVEGFAPLFTRKEVLAGAAALESACASRAAGHDIIHYACHGEFSPAEPWDSCLFLARGTGGAAEDDGKLRAAEVFSLDLAGSRLVALSGCETGREEVLPGDDAISIGTAFLHAGAGALLASLWKVEDKPTALLMQAFYRKYIGERKDKVTALCEAKRELLAGAVNHPRQWGAFILIGEP